jgi:hypothetical protein
MQEKDLISNNNNQPHVSSHTQQLAECIAELWRNTSFPSADTFEHILVALPEPYKTMGIHAIAERFVNTLQLHALQIIATFYQQSLDEGIDAEERDETLKDVEVNTYHLMMSNKQLAVNSLETLLRLGKITASVQDLSQCDNAEEAQRWMYKLPNIYQSRLRQEHLTGKGFDITVNFSEGSAMIQTKITMAYTSSDINMSIKDTIQAEQYQTEQVNKTQQWGKVLLSPYLK